MADFTSLPLHDAVLRSVTVLWPDRECVLELSVFYRTDEPARPSRLVFSGLTLAQVPHSAPWGESKHVNSCAMERPGRYEIEMQSGDVLVFEATGFALSQLTAAQQGAAAAERQ